MRERGVDGVRDGGLQPRAGAWAGSDGVVFDVGGLHQPRPRPPRLPPRHGGLLRGQGLAVHPARCRPGLVNVDDEHGRRLLRAGRRPGPRPSRPPAPDADWRAVDVELAPSGSRFTRRSAPTGARRRPAARCPVASTSPTPWPPSPRCAAAGFDAAAVAAAIAAGAGVPGRLERVDAGQDFAVVVDYAHKPDAVEAALRTLRPLTEGRLIVVLGAGGDRDPGKRPMMGEIAARRRRRPGGDRRQPAHRGPGRDPGRDPGRGRGGPARGAARSATGAPRSARRWPGPARRRRAGRRQGPRDRPGGRAAWCTRSTTARCSRACRARGGADDPA